MAIEQIFLPVSEAGKRLDVCNGRVYQLISAGLLPGIKRGRRILIPRQAFDTYVENINEKALENLLQTESLVLSRTRDMARGSEAPLRDPNSGEEI